MKTRFCAKITKAIKEEEQSSVEYHKLGIDDIANDESRHAEMLKKMLKRRCN
ncbi:MAG: hypothetical protein NT076_02650 [Candidatus Pacearchaeota archaeon]|nr:hypothetical protein [Candidatus Pacearchaeota archaeon]